MPHKPEAARMAALAAAILLLGASLIPEAAAAARGARCETWERRQIDLQRTREKARADAAQIILQQQDTPTLEEARETYRSQNRGRPEWYLQEARDWMSGRYSGCGPFDAAEATTTSRQASHYATVVHSTARNRNAEHPAGPQTGR